MAFVAGNYRAVSQAGMRRHLLSTVVLSALLFAVCACSAGSANALSLTLTASKNVYVVGEPISIEAVLTNDTSVPRPFLGLDCFTENMTYMYYEVKAPSGVVAKRRFEYIHDIGYNNPGYVGEFLAPGQSVRTSLQLAVTGEEVVVGGDGRTFPAPGNYSIAAVYYIPRVFEKVRDGNDGVWEFRSNELSLDIVDAPDESTKRIIEACWANGPTPVGYMRAGSLEHEELLRAVIQDYPDNGMVKYARLMLATSLGGLGKGYRAKRITEAIRRFEEIRSADPEFYLERIARELGGLYFNTKQPRQGGKVFLDAIERAPDLVDDYEFMHLMIALSSGPELVEQWYDARKVGDGEADSFVHRLVEMLNEIQTR